MSASAGLPTGSSSSSASATLTGMAPKGGVHIREGQLLCPDLQSFGPASDQDSHFKGVTFLKSGTPQETQPLEELGRENLGREISRMELNS